MDYCPSILKSQGSAWDELIHQEWANSDVLFSFYLFVHFVCVVPLLSVSALLVYSCH